MKILKNKNVILVDYFDTLVYRCVSTSTVQLQWAVNLKVKFAELKNFTPEQILQIRNDIKYSLKDDFDEVPYNVLMEKVCEYFKLNTNKEQFCAYSKALEESIELGVQFANKKLVKVLQKQKQLGKKIYLVSDFYLPLSSFKKFLSYHNILNLFDDVFVSSEVNHTKRRNGAKLFLYALQQIGCKAQNAIMIGDNYQVDYLMCKQVGIDSIFYKRKNKKILNYQKLSALTFNKKFINFKLSSWKETPFLEYSILFYLFTKYLTNKAKTDNVKKLTFLSRDGYFLNKLFWISKFICAQA